MHVFRGTIRIFGPSLLVGLVAPYLFPAIRRGAKPAAKGVIRGAILLSESVKEGVTGAREQLSDLVAEVKADLAQESQESQSGKRGNP
jgi:hypothetical protein